MMSMQVKKNFQGGSDCVKFSCEDKAKLKSIQPPQRSDWKRLKKEQEVTEQKSGCGSKKAVF